MAQREPNGPPGPRLCIVRTVDSVAWAVRADTPNEVADLAASESPPRDVLAPPVHDARYRDLLTDSVESGPAFVFPDGIESPFDVIQVRDIEVVRSHFSPDEFDARLPVFAVVVDGHAVSFCHCARLSDDAAEAGLFTEPSHRGRGFGPRVTAAWASAIRATGRTPIYSTSWRNTASQAVARKIGLRMFASDYSVR